MALITETKKIAALISTIRKKRDELASKKVTAGFDGFVDTIVRIVRSKAEATPVLFNHIKEFGEYILEKQAGSFSLEIEEISSKAGGNMPIMANALGRLGISVNCLGALGYPQTHPAFKEFPPRCRIYSFADPGTSTAFEFNDGKMMLAQMGALNKTGWNEIKNIIGIDTLIELYKECDMLCTLNWSEIDASTDIWKGLLKEVFAKLTGNKNQIAFFDLSDCSKRSAGSIKEVFELLLEFAQHTKLILSLNKNETRIVCSALYDEDPGKDLEGAGKKIFEKIGSGILLIHTSREALAFDKEGIVRTQSFFIQDPLVSTGAGDNFNAGFAAAQLLDLDIESSLLMANAVAALYVKSGVASSLTK